MSAPRCGRSGRSSAPAARSSGWPSPATTRSRRSRRFARASTLPLVADIHFDHRLAIACIDAGADKVRINPGNIGGTKRLQEVARRAGERGCAIRVGVNAGSLEKDLQVKHGGATPAALVESAVRAVRDLEAVGFRAIVVSLKASSVLHTHRRLPARRARAALPAAPGRDRGRLGARRHRQVLGRHGRAARGRDRRHPAGLAHRHPRGGGARRPGDPLRASGCAARGSRSSPARPAAAAASTCSAPPGRCAARLADVTTPLTVAVMGCPVNGPGEARAADVGLAGGKGKAVIFSRGKILKTVPESRMIDALVEAVRRAVRRATSGARAGGRGAMLKRRSERRAVARQEHETLQVVSFRVGAELLRARHRQRAGDRSTAADHQGPAGALLRRRGDSRARGDHPRRRPGAPFRPASRSSPTGRPGSSSPACAARASASSSAPSPRFSPIPAKVDRPAAAADLRPRRASSSPGWRASAKR